MKAEYCVDYLSYKWKTDDLIQTFKENCKHSTVDKQDIYEQHKLIRLKNALWREMARTCTSNLSRSNELIDPSSVCWQKESDITWLYGPMYTLHNEIQTRLCVPVSHLEGIKPVLKKHSALVQRLPTCSEEIEPYHSSGNTSYISSRNNSFSSISSTGSKIGVHFNPEIIEIEYQPEYPVSTTHFNQEDGLWSSLLIYLQQNHSSVNLVILLLKSFFSITCVWLICQRLSRWADKRKTCK